MKRTPISNELRRRVFDRDNYTCRYCGDKQGPFQADHVYPVSKGGETTISNLVTSCGPCNIKKSNKVGIWPRPVRSRTVKQRSGSNIGAVLFMLGMIVVAVSSMTMQLHLSPFYAGIPGAAATALGLYFILRG